MAEFSFYCYCSVCGSRRLDGDINVFSVWFDSDEVFNLMQRNMNYCKDNLFCVKDVMKNMVTEIRQNEMTGLSVAIDQEKI